MYSEEKNENISISPKSHRLLMQLLDENAKLKDILNKSESCENALKEIKNWVLDELQSSPSAESFYNGTSKGRDAFEKLSWKDYATIRILDYIDNAGRKFEDLNLRGEIINSNPFGLVWTGLKKGTCGAKPEFFEDMIQLFRQFSEKNNQKPVTREQLEAWMARHPSGLDPRIIDLREKNKIRILNILIDKIDKGEISGGKHFSFEQNMTKDNKLKQALKWWQDKNFHLHFAVRDPDLLNEMLNYSLDPDTMKILYDAKKAGIPFFVNPHYLSLLNISEPDFAVGCDLPIRDYIVYSNQLVNEFGHIVAWEKEDIVEPGKPNAAGWILPTHDNIHRRYPEVAILIPDTVGRACGGLCSSCQRMYDFQNGRLNFNLDKLKPKISWKEKLEKLMDYFENDSQLRDILITGGDALMSSDSSLKQMFDAVYNMALRKKQANESRPDGKKYAEIVRIRLGSRLLSYLPHRITPELCKILAEFKDKASKIGLKQFVIQTHIQSAMEITPDTKKAISNILESGWIITNQLVFSAASSRRGHTAKLRKVLCETGVLPYYTFTVKGYMENNHNFATNARSVQEQIEEKVFGIVPDNFRETIKQFPLDAPNIVKNSEDLRQEANILFLSTDRNVLNLPGVGKSLTFRVIGITRHGRRILEFDHDATRNHSPIINKMGKVVIIESKPVSVYLKQLENMGEDPSEYETIFGYSIGETEPRMPVYEYPEYDFNIDNVMTNLEID